jgi:hydroxybutyrate-dimer hydrolase
VTYANAYGRFSVKDTLCGFSYGATDGTGNPTPAPVNNVEQIFALGNGIPPTAGINLIYDPSVGGPKHERAAISPSTNRQDIALDGALCLHALATGTECVNDFETLFSKNYCRSFSSSGCPGLCAAGSSGLLIQTALGRG